MNIKTITCHNVYNYGASLQAYALQQYLESLGHDVEIIDFQPWFHQDRYNKNYIDHKRKLYKFFHFFPSILNILHSIKDRHQIDEMKKMWGRKIAFDNFTHEYLHLTRRYNTSQELQDDPPTADVYVAGSDQIWNTESRNGKEPGYYLDFGDAKKISYAASFAVSKIQEELKSFVKGELSNFQHISVREKTGLSILEDLGIKGGVQVMDPVFLLDKEEWSILSSKAKDYNLAVNKYILVYDFLCDNRIASLVKILKEKSGFISVSINDFQNLPYVDKNIDDAGPLEFISLIKNASMVVCSSFHATAFSLIFNKPFYVFPLNSQKNSSRMEDLLHMINHHERFLPQQELEDMNYDNINTILAKEIERSKKVLQTFINK